MAAPIPCTIRLIIRTTKDPENTAAPQHRVNTAMPAARTGFMHVTSASLPMGTEKAATASVYPVMSQPAFPALTPNSPLMPGMDRFSALPVKVVINAVITTTVTVILCILF